FRSHTSGGKATQADRDKMTQLIRDIRTMTEQVGMERGSPILLSIRVPDSVGYCNDIGLDVNQWLQEGLVDLMTVNCFFRAEDWSASVAMGHQYNVPVYASLSETRMTGPAGEIRGSFDSYMGRASAAWAEGVDGIYMFNYTNDDHPNSPLWKLAGDPATLEGVNKIYTTGARGVEYMSSGLAGGLSHLNRTVVSPERTMSIAPGQTRTIPLTIGDDLSDRTPEDARVRLRLQTANLPNANRLGVRLNGQLLTGGVLSNGYLDFAVDLALVNRGVNEFRLEGSPLLTQNVTLQDLLVYVSFRPTGFRAPMLEEAFLTGSPANPAAGEYALGPLVGAEPSPSVGRFLGSWSRGQGSNTSRFQVVGSGLGYADMDAREGAVRFHSPTAISGKESVLRPFDASDVTTDDRVFYMAGLMSFDQNFSTAANAIALTGLLNAEEGDPSVSYTIGLQWGFRGDGDGGVDAVVRYRDNGSPYPVVTNVVGDNIQPGTHLFVMRVDVDVDGGLDNVTVWLNPTNLWAEGLPSLGLDGACWLTPNGDPNRLVDTLVFST
ncbi:MAG: hypothetical protein GX621_03555, partial [Pirellulaceae bacterium]|nr:hypothetical protein [Pirellulaceae bacterium]